MTSKQTYDKIDLIMALSPKIINLILMPQENKPKEIIKNIN